MSVELRDAFDTLLGSIKKYIKEIADFLLNGFDEDASVSEEKLQTCIEEAVKIWTETILCMEHPSSDDEKEISA